MSPVPEKRKERREKTRYVISLTLINFTYTATLLKNSLINEQEIYSEMDKQFVITSYFALGKVLISKIQVG